MDARRCGHVARGVPLAFVAVVLTACSTAPKNPSFPLEIAEAQEALERMRSDPKPLSRPLLLFGGYIDPGVAVGHLEGELGAVTEGRIIPVSFALCGDFDACRGRVVTRINEALPGQSPVRSRRFDVVGVSMGGLVARHAAAQEPKRLRIVRLFTIATPHRGAEMAALPTLHPLQRAMREGSSFLDRLKKAGTPYRVFPYVRLGDAIVGVGHAAPRGRHPWWVPNRPLDAAHLGAYRDPRILADIAARLRGEAPFTKRPPRPPPES